MLPTFIVAANPRAVASVAGGVGGQELSPPLYYTPATVVVVEVVVAVAASVGCCFVVSISIVLLQERGEGLAVIAALAALATLVDNASGARRIAAGT